MSRGGSLKSLFVGHPVVHGASNRERGGTITDTKLFENAKMLHKSIFYGFYPQAHNLKVVSSNLAPATKTSNAKTQTRPANMPGGVFNAPPERGVIFWLVNVHYLF